MDTMSKGAAGQPGLTGDDRTLRRALDPADDGRAAKSRQAEAYRTWETGTQGVNVAEQVRENKEPLSAQEPDVLSKTARRGMLVPQTILEGLLFVSGEPLTISTLQDFLPEATPQDVRRWIDLLNRAYLDTGRVFRIIEVAGGFQIVTREELDPWIEGLCASKRAAALSRAAMEALTIVAYRQPVNRAEIERIRGVDSHAVLRTLLGRGLVRVSGRAKTPGRPLLFTTTKAFLEEFGLRDLDDLPSEEEIEQLVEKSLAPEGDGGYLRRPEVR